MSTRAPIRISVSAVVHPEPGGGYWGEVPDLPGCVTQGDSLDELLDNLREAIAAHQDLNESEVQITSLEMAA